MRTPTPFSDSCTALILAWLIRLCAHPRKIHTTELKYSIYAVYDRFDTTCAKLQIIILSVLIALLINISHGSIRDAVWTVLLIFSPSLLDMPTISCPLSSSCLANSFPMPFLCPVIAIFIEKIFKSIYSVRIFFLLKYHNVNTYP